MTVDWSRWMSLTDAEKRALWAQYRAVVQAEIQRAKFNNWQRLDLAIRFPFTWRQKQVAR